MNRYRISGNNLSKPDTTNEILVFGSNLLGRHGAGAALTAVRKFGAINGKGIGIQGNSYGIPTKGKNIEVLSIKEITKHVNTFISYAKKNKDKIFLITEIGCGLAGYSPKDIAPLFEKCLYLENCYLPKSFITYNENK